MKALSIFIFLFLFNSLNAQNSNKYTQTIDWLNYSDSIKIGIETISQDSIIITSNLYKRKNMKGFLIELIDFEPLNKIMCDDDGLKLTGYCKRYYETGEIKSIGKLVCNNKIGEWLYFYKSGQIEIFENYKALELIDSNPNITYLNGTYLEYHPNGNLKTRGFYKIIEENIAYETFDFEKYSITNKCCKWVPLAIKTGNWESFDNTGELIKIKSQKPYEIDSKKYREIADRYLEININKIKYKNKNH